MIAEIPPPAGQQAHYLANTIHEKSRQPKQKYKHLGLKGL
jgi:hypothetical protein